MKPREIAESYVFQHYGNLTTLGDLQFDEDERKWYAELKSDYPRILKDDSRVEQPIVRFIPMSRIGKIVFDNEFNVLQATPRSEIGEGIRGRLTLWRDQAERIMVQASSDQIARLRGADHVLYPIIVILDNLLHPLDGRPLITQKQIETDDDPTKLYKYLDLLRELEVVELRPEGWSTGPLFTPLQEKSESQNADFYRAILSLIMRERYSAIRDIFHIGRFERYIHADNCYYWYALDAGKLMYTEKRKLFSRYASFYAEAGDMSLNTIFNELAEVGVLEFKGNLAYGNPALFDKMLELKDKESSIGLVKA